MTAPTQHPLVTDYLTRLRASAFHHLPESDARDLMGQVQQQFDEATRGAAGEAEVQALVDRLGTPEALVAAAAPPPAPESSPPGQPTREIRTVMLLLSAEVLALSVLLLPIGIIVWLVGMVMLALCRRWNTRQLATAWMVLASGFPLAMLALAAAGLASGRSISWLPWVLAMVGIGFGALQVVTARRLLAAVGSHGPRPQGLRLR